MKLPIDLPTYQFEHLSQGHYLRGVLINEFSGLEKKIEKFIVSYFIDDKDKGNEMSNIILDRLTFEAKRTSFKAILDKRSVENGFVKTKNNSYPESKFFDEIRRLNDHRIYFAHYVMVMPMAITDNVIGLAEFRDSVKIKWYTQEQFETLIGDIMIASNKIQALIDGLKST
ncbi:hypothetical protein KXQ82_00995 [Mucilaginibacter sp. HMF5004]|uniref:hypothetical protein n=1 Tax=Mucilaginibacter rivuli TaxID=2857527 RepID=UPI001C5F8D8D|nr:hypothetical protein [Mucilaginibacter rivuli]MBW4888265.1 hypothetical protein [Mucilaginibacter rivuli]